MLEVAEVTAGYGPVNVLWDIDLHVEAGEIVALVGGNGAGKSTLLRTISGLLTPSSGRIRFKGDDIAGVAPEKIVGRGIAHVPEGRRLFAGLSVGDNLLMGAHHRSDGDVAADLERVFDMFPRLRDRREQLAGHLSGGEQQMCAIGRGLMSRPALLMIDELSLGLAPNLVDLFLSRLQDIAADGTAILVVEQDVDAALESSARAYVLESGRIVLDGESSVLLDDPRVQDAYLGVT